MGNPCVTEHVARRCRDVLIAEAAMKFAGLAVLIAAAAQWLDAEDRCSQSDVLAIKLVLTAALAGLRPSLFRYADRGTEAELQVDAALREIRVGDRTLRGAIRACRNRSPDARDRGGLRPHRRSRSPARPSSAGPRHGLTQTRSASPRAPMRELAPVLEA